MSEETLDIYRTQRLEQTESGTFSEEFEIIGGVKFFGIFDSAHSEGYNDAGHVVQRPVQKRIMVNETPASLIPKTSTILRIGTGKVFSYVKDGHDDEGVPVLWLS